MPDVGKWPLRGREAEAGIGVGDTTLALGSGLSGNSTRRSLLSLALSFESPGEDTTGRCWSMIVCNEVSGRPVKASRFLTIVRKRFMAQSSRCVWVVSPIGELARSADAGRSARSVMIRGARGSRPRGCMRQIG
jgi:hypothetical protein